MKKSLKCTLAIALTLVMTLGIGVPAFAAAAPAAAVAAAPAAVQEETTRDRALTFAILLIPYIGPFVAFFMSSDRMAMLPTFLVTLFVPIAGALLYLFGVI